MQPTNADQLLTPAEVAAMLFVDPKTVTRWARAGKLDAIRTPGGHRRYLRSDVVAIMTGDHHSQRPGRPQAGRGDLGIVSPRTADEGLDAVHAAAVADSEAVALALEAEAEEAAEAVIVTAAAVATAAERAATAAARARDARAFAAAEVARTVAVSAREDAKRAPVPAQRGS